MRLRKDAWLVVFLVAASCGTLAAESPLDALPPHAFLVLRVKSPIILQKKFTDLTGLSNNPLLAGFLDPKMFVSQPENFSIDASGDWWFIWISEGADEGEVVIALPATDPKKAKEQLDAHNKAQLKAQDGPPKRLEETFIYKHWLFTNVESEGIVSTWQRFKGDAKESAATIIDPQSRALLEKGDVGLYLNLPQLRELDPSTFEETRKGIDEFLVQIGTSLASLFKAQEPAIPEWAGKIARSIGAGLGQSFSDVRGVGMSVSIEKQRLEAEARWTVAPATPSAFFLQRHPPAEMKPLGLLPAGKPFYFGLTGDLNELGHLMTEFSVAQMHGKPAAMRAVADAAAALNGRKTTAYYGCLAAGNSRENPLTFAAVSQTNRADGVAAFERLFVDRYERPSPAGVQYRRSVEIVGRRTVDSVISEPGSSESVPKPAANATPNIALARDFKTTVVPGFVLRTAGSERGEMERLLENFDAGTGAASQKPWREARSRLDQKANLVVLIDTPHAVVDALRSLRWIYSSAADMEPVARAYAAAVHMEQDFVPSYAGLSLTAEREGLRLKLSVPREQFQGTTALLDATLGSMH